MSSLNNIIFHLVDDNDIDIAVNSKLLQLSKFSDNIFTYNGAARFLDHVQSADFDKQSPHVVLLDIMMPNINGFECLEQLEKMPDEIKEKITVFMLSSSIDRNDIRRAESYSLVEKILEKPLDIYLLKKHLEEVFE